MKGGIKPLRSNAKKHTEEANAHESQSFLKNNNSFQKKIKAKETKIPVTKLTCAGKNIFLEKIKGNPVEMKKPKRIRTLDNRRRSLFTLICSFISLGTKVND